MARNRVTYQCEAAFIGPAIISGLVPVEGPENFERIQSLSLGFEEGRQAISQIGTRGTVSDPMLDTPIASVQISYLGAGLKNEKNVGLNVNFSSGFSQPSYYHSSQEVSVVSGFANEDNRSLDRRNLYIGIASEGIDVENRDSLTGIIGFSNCHLSQYSSSIQQGGFLQNSMSFIATDASFFVLEQDVGLVDMPIINFKHVDNLPTHSVSLPYYQSTGITALRGAYADIELSTNSLSNIGIDTFSMKPQSYSLQINLEREPLQGIGYRYPLDQALKFPVKGVVSISALVSERNAGRIGELCKNDQAVNLIANFNTPPAGDDCAGEKRLAIQHKMVNGYLMTHEESMSIGENKQVNMTFAVDIDPDDLSKGMFMSGNLNS
jgi:hypothetical protein